MNDRRTCNDEVQDNASAYGSVLLTHDVGLHARPSVTLTKLAKRFNARIDVGLSREGPWVDAKSIARVMKMKVPKDSILHVQAHGVDAEAAVKALVVLVQTDFQTGQPNG